MAPGPTRARSDLTRRSVGRNPPCRYRTRPRGRPPAGSYAGRHARIATGLSGFEAVSGLRAPVGSTARGWPRDLEVAPAPASRSLEGRPFPTPQRFKGGPPVMLINHL